MSFNRESRDNPFKCCFKCSEKRVTEDFNCHTNCERYARAVAINEENKRLIEKNLSQATVVTNFDFDNTARARIPKDHKPIRHRF